MNRRPSVVSLRSLATAELGASGHADLRRLFAAAWPDGDFSEDDFQHAMGGRHWLLEVSGRIASHASVVERTLWVAEQPLRTGYLEAVATEPAWQGRGFGTRVVRAATDFIGEHYELGALSTGSPAFYERLGWRRWRGPTYVRTSAGQVRTVDDDDGILYLQTATSPPIDPSTPLTCDWRPGDAW